MPQRHDILNPQEHAGLPDFGAFRPMPQPRGAAGPGGLRLLPLQAIDWAHFDAAGAHLLIWLEAGEIIASGQKIVAGTLYFAPLGTGGRLDMKAAPRGTLLLIGADLAQSLAATLPDARVSASLAGGDAQALRQSLRQIAAALPRAGDQARAALMAEVELLALRLARLSNDGQSTPLTLAPAPQPASPRALLREFMELAEANLGSGATVADLAQIMAVSAADLDRACLEGHGKRALAVIYQLRMDVAVRALRETCRPATDIAREIGFTSYAHFCRVFVAETGRLPETFRS
ncbi:MAG: AraC family transcriptional regulator [Paracoccus sp. (in: a-proteobacteria)]|nr:AraC family transcriptional regulator [Paracoccus sp. (in: a-proteobacteria)]